MPLPPKAIIRITDYNELHELVHGIMAREGMQCDLNHIDVSQMTTLRGLFAGSHFEGDVSQWNVSNIEEFTALFADCRFNGDLSKWDTSRATNMERMFQTNHAFNGDISNWNVSNVTNFGSMFSNNPFTGDLSKWKTNAGNPAQSIMSPRQLKKMSAPSEFHWCYALHSNKGYTFEDLLQPAWTEHLQEMQPLIASFGLTPREQVQFCQEGWLQKHHPSSIVSLPEFGI